MYYGCGAKAALSYTSSYEVICRKDNVERKFLIFKGEEYPESTKIYEKETTEQNGVLIRVSIDKWDFNEAKTAIRQQLCYFPTAFIQIEGDNFDYTKAQIFQNDLFSWSEIYPSSEMHINFGGVHYPIDWEILKMQRLTIPIGIKIAPDNGISPFFNRESLEYTALCKQTIKETISKIADYFVNKYNEQTPDERELLEAWDDIDKTDKIVKLANEEFRINYLLQYSTITPKELKIKGIELETPEYYYNLRTELLDEYEVVAEYKHSWKTKRISKWVDWQKCLNKKLILVNNVPTHKVKSFLMDKYTDVQFIRKAKTRKLGKVTAPYNSRRDEDYIYLLNLVMKPKEKWRSLINEWIEVENQFKSLIIDETNVENSQEFIQYCINKKEEAKNNRKNGYYSSKSNYVRINKTKEDITIQIGMRKEIGEGVKFVKKAVKIADLNKLHKNTHALHIYFPEEQKERASQFYELFSARYNVCLLSPRELKKLQEFKPKQFKTEMEFVKTNAFKRIMTSLKYEKAINLYKSIYNNSASNIIDECLQKFSKEKEQLQEYIRNNGKHIDNHLLEELIGLAEENNLYDYQYEDVYQSFLRNIKKYEFIKCLEKPRSWVDGDVERYTKTINSLLYLQQKHNNFEEFDVILQPKSVTAVEETILEEQLETV